VQTAMLFAVFCLFQQLRLTQHPGQTHVISEMLTG